ncbi:MAG: hypothetical protein U0232_03440 [Thermomicrobiales bacterium]
MVRFVDFQWLEARFHKVTDANGAWDYGSAEPARLLEGAVAIPQTGTPEISYDWYRTFLERSITARRPGSLIAWGEVLVGIGLIVGGLVGIAAFFKALMNMSMLAGSASTNPVLFILAVALMLAWHVAGYYGADRFILPIIGAPWAGKLFNHGGSPVPVPAS